MAAADAEEGPSLLARVAAPSGASLHASWGPGLQLRLAGLPPATSDDAMHQDDAFTTVSSVQWWVHLEPILV